MPYNSNGVHTLDPGYNAITGQDIVPSQHNPPLEDVSGSLSMVYVKDGRAPLTGDMNAGGNKLTNIADGVNPQDAATVGQAASVIGDFKDTARTLDEKWLRRNGAIYSNADYPDLASLLGPLPDTINWTPHDTSQSNTLYAIAQDGAKYRAVGNSGTLLGSADRAAWASISPGTSANLQFISKTPSFWLAAGTLTPSGGSVTVRSTDGDNWASTTLASGNYMTEIRGLGWTGTNVLVSGYDSRTTTVHRILYGTDGTSWTPVTVATSGVLAASPSRAVLASRWDNGGMVLTSDNQGVTWTTRVASGFGNVNDICWDTVNNLWIAVFDGGVIKTSPDGIAWTTRASGTTANLLSVRAGPNGIMAVGSGQNFVLFSTNGTTWASKAAPTTTGRALLADNTAAYHFLSGNTTTICDGIRTLPTQFQVPNDEPQYGWIKAL